MKKPLLCLCVILIAISSAGAYSNKGDGNINEKGTYTDIGRPVAPSPVIINPTPSLGTISSHNTDLLLRETQLLKEEVSRLRQDFAEQKGLTSNLVNRVIQIIESQNQLLDITSQNALLFENISHSTSLINRQLTFMDGVILDKTGIPYAFIEDGSKIYEYSGGSLLGIIGPQNEVIRNSDGSIIGVVEKDFIVDATGHPIASIERSENLRWDREKLYAKVQKNPVSRFFIMNSPLPFNLSNFRFSTWSNQDIKSVLYFDEGEVQKLK